MTNQRDQLALRSRLEEVLGRENATTLFAMFAQRDDLASKGDLAAVRDELKTEIAEVRDDLKTEMAALRDELKTEIAMVRSDLTSFRVEVEHRFATRDDLLELRRDFDVSLRSFVRTFTATQAATVVGMTGIFYALLRLT